MMENIITFIRSWFITPPNGVSRKRRAPDSIQQQHAFKCRKTSSPIVPTRGVDIDISPIMSSRPTIKTRPIVIDDEDDDVIVVKGGKRKTFTSTPNDSQHHSMNGHNAPEMSKHQKSFTDRYFEAKKSGYSYFTRFSSAVQSMQNQTRSREPKMVDSHIHNSSLDLSIRLDDKLKYQKLLDTVTKQDGSSIYYTPEGKMDNPRARKIQELIRKSSVPVKKNIEFVDLTNEKKTKLSTRDTVLKVLDDFDKVAVIEDSSDSDVEVLPTPPSPKPDIKVDRVNSLKKIVDTSKSSKNKWLQEKCDNVNRFIKIRQEEIEQITEQSKQLSLINQELRIQSLARKVDDSLAIKDVILPEKEDEDVALPELTEEHFRMVSRAFAGDPNEVLVKKFNINIIRRDIQTLSGLNWLNDNIINFYMNLIIERGKDATWPNVYCMNTFFYQRLTKDGPESLRRWTKRIDIFAHEIICVPIHLGVHWCMAIIDLKERSIKYYDSMVSKNWKCLEALKGYLEYEHMDKKKQPFDTSDFVLENVKDLPQQMNGSDCGVFSCTFAEFASRHAKFTFTQENMPYIRKKMVCEILMGEMMIK